MYGVQLQVSQVFPAREQSQIQTDEPTPPQKLPLVERVFNSQWTS